eukprot:TRINITY_DN9954_c0_g1_i7.p1 TRINITY_DN9954_c0_g1~~TRINITY_DN9954_c0_g1_i7.p1  ORF type:complete len:281 (-),score=21.27 TRINITY_DN9954_c0_g1_i7:213-1055(-)
MCLKTDSMPTPKRIVLERAKVMQVACGLANTTFLTAEGAVLVCGLGQYTGLGAVGVVRTPTVVQALWGKQVRYIDAGAAHTAVLTASHQMFVWGKGHGPKGRDQLTCKLVGPRTAKVFRIACGPHCTIAFRRSCKGDASHCTPETPASISSKVILSAALRLAPGQCHDWAVEPSGESRGSRSSYRHLVSAHREDHAKRKHNGVFGVPRPVTHEREDRKELADLSYKCTAGRWRVESPLHLTQLRRSRKDSNDDTTDENVENSVKAPFHVTSLKRCALLCE